MTGDRAGSEPVYLLGHSGAELRRLDLQGRLYRDTTHRCLLAAGLKPGLRVLDVGSGSGDVSTLASEVVGTEGAVVGFDREPAAVAAATERARAAGIGNVHFTTDPGTTGDFDALVGRFILMHQADPARFLSDMSALLRPGGAIAFVESSMEWLIGTPHSFPHSELYDSIVRWKHAVVGSAGADVAAGSRLLEVFHRSGLPTPHLRLEALIAGAEHWDAIQYMADSVRSMLPQAENAGIGVPFGPVDTLAERLAQHLTDTGGSFTLWPTVSAWVKTAA